MPASSAGLHHLAARQISAANPYSEESQQRGLSVSEAHQFNNSADAGEHYTDGLIQRQRPPN